MLSTQDKNKVPRDGEALEDKKKMDEYPFRRELEELLSSPMEGPKDGKLLEEGEIEVCHPLLRSPTNQGGNSQ